ncbi:hypothetical protein EC973_001593 [Apophysomyces ossiformis]|uniref:Uncharacterized protein n=1 Tax=Apophysomyces ossiformis TaxID=679940 RepID=A0A8H7BHN3_9FUNG|nr:hypothetical protein EC973_001593 [Apophysomyces ossiformis]
MVLTPLAHRETAHSEHQSCSVTRKVPRKLIHSVFVHATRVDHTKSPGVVYLMSGENRQSVFIESLMAESIFTNFRFPSLGWRALLIRQWTSILLPMLVLEESRRMLAALMAADNGWSLYVPPKGHPRHPAGHPRCTKFMMAVSTKRKVKESAFQPCDIRHKESSHSMEHVLLATTVRL